MILENVFVCVSHLVVTLVDVRYHTVSAHLIACLTCTCHPHMLQVGFNRAPWVVTPSVYSMMLVNVESTVTRGALYPAKPYHEDVDFAHLCEEKQLVVVKCNWLFFHKVRPQLCMQCASKLSHL